MCPDSLARLTRTFRGVVVWGVGGSKHPGAEIDGPKPQYFQHIKQRQVNIIRFVMLVVTVA